jgi:hypothetical protein
MRMGIMWNEEKTKKEKWEWRGKLNEEKRNMK